MSEATVAEATQAEGAAATQAELKQSSPEDDLKEGSTLLQEIEGETAKAGTEPAAKVQDAKGLTGDEELEQALEARAARAAEEAKEATRREERERQREEREREEAENRQTSVNEAFRIRAPAIRAFLKEKGLEDEDAERVVATFNEHHGQSVQVAAGEVWDSFFRLASRTLSEKNAEEVAQRRRQGRYAHVADLASDLKDRWQAEAKEGLHPESHVTEARALGALSVKRRFQSMLKEDPTGSSVLALLGSQTNPPKSRNGASVPSSRGYKTFSEAQAMNAGRHPSGQTITNIQLQEAKAANRAGQLPD